MSTAVASLFSGAGIAGLSCAYELTRLGRSVFVIDRDPIGWGITLRTTAHLASALDAVGTASSPVTEHAWFRYDSMNRLVTDRGILSGGTIVRGNSTYGTISPGIDYVYDLAGQRVASIRTDYSPGYYDPYFGFYTPGYYQETRENYDYDGAGRIGTIRTTQGTAAGEVYNPGTGLYDPPSSIPAASASGGFTDSSLGYDLMGRQISQSDYQQGVTGAVYSRTAVFAANGALTSDSTSTQRFEQNGTSNTYLTNSTYVLTDSQNGEYLLGAVGTVTASNHKNGVFQTNSSTTNTYQWWDAAVQNTIAYKPNTSQSTTHTTTFYYDAQGTLTSAYIADGRARNVSYRTNGDGQVIRRDEADSSSTSIGDPHEIWYRFGGREFGYVGNNGTSRMTEAASVYDRRAYQATTGAFRNGANNATTYVDFAQSSAPINSYSQGSAAGGYVVQRSGETLRSVAEQLWGDASLWYKLAEANGLSSDMALSEGQRLNVPAGVARTHHNAATLRPYDANDALGNVSPTTPKPPKKNKCGVFGQILLAVVAVAVTALALPSGGASIGIAQGALAGLAGGAASQVVGVATGIQNKFNFKGLALSAIGGGVGAGVTQVLTSGAVAGSQVVGDVLRGAAGSAITQGIGVATGLQSKFSWAGVAAAGVGSGVGGWVSRQLPGANGQWSGKSWNQTGTPSFANQVVAGSASLIAGAATRSAIEGSSFGDNILRGLPDAVGQVVGRALGNMVADRLTRSPRLGYGDVGSDDGVAGAGDGTAPQPTVGTGGGQIGGSPGAANGSGAVLSEWDYSAPGDGEPALNYVDTNGDIVIEAVNRPDHSDYWRSVTGGYSLSSYTPSLWMDLKQAVWGRQHQAYAQWNGGGLGYVAAPVTFVLSPLTGVMDLGSSYYRGRHGWVAPADREATDIALIGIGGVETMASKMGRLGSVGASGGIEAAYQARYAAAYERGLAKVDAQLAAGEIRAPAGQPEHLFKANRVDAIARDDLRRFAEMQGHGTDLVRINQRLYLEGTSGKYRVPDLYFPQSRTIFDGTLDTKTLKTPQIIDFRAATGNAPIGIVRPQSYGGSYWLGN